MGILAKASETSSFSKMPKRPPVQMRSIQVLLVASWVARGNIQKHIRFQDIFNRIILLRHSRVPGPGYPIHTLRSRSLLS